MVVASLLRPETCDFIIEPPEERALRDEIGKSAVLKLDATADAPIVIHYDHKLAGESATNPQAAGATLLRIGTRLNA